MTAPARLPVVLFWHMHQPHYRDALTGEYVLPWTYLHAIKDYTDMAAHLEDHPAARAVFNFTPVLLEQLEELSRRIAGHLADGAPLPDPVLALLGPDAVPAEGDARLALVRACLRAQRQHLIERFPVYRELVELVQPFLAPERIAYLSDALVHDLAIWYHLAWLGETIRRTDPRVAALMSHSRGFSIAQRRQLLAIVGELIAGIIPRYRALADSGRAELSVSPYGHPILPLLLDFHAVRESVPSSTLPHHAGYPGGAERAAWHVAESLRLFEAAFGRRPAGCWPSEGAVGTEVLRLLDSFGFRWAATSSNVLRASLDAVEPALAERYEAYDRPYVVPGTQVQCWFRDDGLSDLIGFNYSTWHGDDAANDLVNRLVEIADRHNGRSDNGHSGNGHSGNDHPGHAVLIALDGENAWEHYPFNGYYFLRALYAALADHPRLELTTLGACVERGLQPQPLARVVAGSWVHGTLATWMGDPAKNAAWDLLCEAKLAFDRVIAGGTLDPVQRAAAERQLALCESSDWFWWFGDYNPADAVEQFDRLYRRQLATLYRLLGLAPPQALERPISIGHGAPEHGGVMRRAHAG